MDSVKIITSYKYEKPMEHSYEITTSKDFRLALCVPSVSIAALTGAAKSVQLTFFKQSKKGGFQ